MHIPWQYLGYTLSPMPTVCTFSTRRLPGSATKISTFTDDKLSHYMMSRLTPHKALFLFVCWSCGFGDSKSLLVAPARLFQHLTFHIVLNTLTIGSTLPSVYVQYPCRNAMHIIGLIYLFTVLFPSLYCKLILGLGGFGRISRDQSIVSTPRFENDRLWKPNRVMFRCQGVRILVHLRLGKVPTCS
jgi:hypothetical protein